MEEEHQVTPGMLLAAWPDMLDPNFMHGVILVCQHAPAGAYGVVVNRPSPNTTADLLGDHPVLGQVPFPVHVGGPVEPETMQFLHTVPDEVPGGTCLDGRIWFGGEIEGVARLISADFDRAKRCVRVLVGYAGWGLSANSFFQTNTLQAERLIDAVRAGAALTGDEVVFDVCSGTGVLGLVLARDAREVWGFELVDAAVADARRNAEQNGVTCAHFIAGDVRTTLSDAGLVAKGVPAPDLCIVDPPRGGLHPVALGALRRLAPARIVYVSCNVQNAVPDMEALAIEGYRLFSARPIDLFPHTPHLEGVFVLCRG